MARRGQRFSKLVQPFPCVVCGKNTTGIDSTECCRDCYDEAGRENTHNDNHRVGAPVEGCDYCAPVESAPEKSKAEFITFLQTRLIPDLRESGRDATADDFETCIHFMTQA